MSSHHPSTDHIRADTIQLSRKAQHSPLLRWVGLPLATLAGALALLQVWPSPASPAALEAAEARVLAIVKSPLEHRMVQAGSYQIHTVIVGDQQKPPLVLLHGHGGGVGVFALNFDALAEHYTVYAVDLLGWGRSARPPFLGRSAAEAQTWWVESLEAWRQAMGLEQLTLLGHSMGGFVAASYALAHPEPLTHLILVDAAGMTVPVHPKNGVYFNLPPQRIVRLAGPLGPALVAFGREEEVSRSPYHDNTLIDYYYQLSAAPGSGEFAFGYILGLTEWRLPILDRMGELSMPVTLIWGEDDVLISPDNGRLAHARIPQSELILIPGAAHAPHSEQPARFHEAVLQAGLHYRLEHHK